MREIKFRAWDKINNKMVQFSLEYPRYFINPIAGGYLYDAKHGDHIVCNLMQYTGLKDKNGREIYEGDIVTFYKSETFVGPELEGVFKEVVKYDEEHGRFQLTGVWPFLCKELAGTELEIIGNIYQKPDQTLTKN